MGANNLVIACDLLGHFGQFFLAFEIVFLNDNGLKGFFLKAESEHEAFCVFEDFEIAFVALYLLIFFSFFCS